MSKEEEIGKMLELGMLDAETFIHAVFGHCTGAGLSDKEGILFYTPFNVGFFGCGSFLTSDEFRVAVIQKADAPKIAKGERYGSESLQVKIRLNVEITENGENLGWKELVVDVNDTEGPQAARAWIEELARMKANVFSEAAAEKYEKANKAAENDNWPDALRFLEEALRDSPESAQLLTDAGRAAYLCEDFVKSSEYLKKAERLGSLDEGTVNWFLGNLALELDSDPDRALQYAKSLIAVDQSNAYAHWLAARACKEKNELKMAESHLERALDGQPNDVDILHTRLEILTERQDVDEAIKLTDRILRSEKDKAPLFLFSLTIALVVAKRIDDAQRYLDVLVELAPDAPQTKVAVAFIRFFGGRSQEALQAANALSDEELTAFCNAREFALLFGFMGMLSRDVGLLRRVASILSDSQQPWPDAAAMGHLFMATSSVFDSKVEDIHLVHRQLSEFEKTFGLLEKRIDEKDEEAWLRAMASATTGAYGYFSFGNPNQAIRRLKEAAFIVRESVEEVQEFGPSASAFLDYVDAFVNELGNRIIEGSAEHASAAEATAVSDGTVKNAYQMATGYFRLVSVHQETLDYSRRVSEILTEFDQPLLITVVGEFNVGKSTFINALIGESVAPMDVVPTTATISCLKYGEKPGLRIFFRDGRVEEAELYRLEKYTKETENPEYNEFLRSIDFVEILYPLEGLKKVNVVDTPGLNALVEEHQTITEKFVERSDSVLWLFRADAAGKASEKSHLQFLQEHQKKTVGVVNQIDLIDQEEVDDILDNLRNTLGQYLAEVVGVSAKDALEGKQNQNNQLLKFSNFVALEEIIQQRLTAESRQIKEHATVGKLDLVHEEILEDRKRREGQRKASALKVKNIQKSVEEFSKASRESLKSEVTRFGKDVDACINELLEQAYELFKRRASSGLSEGDVQQLADDGYKKVSGLFEESKNNSLELAEKFKQSFDEHWIAFFAEYDPSLEKMFAHLRNHYESKLGDLDDYYESERFYVHGFMRGGAWHTVNNIFRSVDFDNNENLKKGNKKQYVEAANAFMSQLGEEIVARHSRRTRMWFDEYVERLSGFARFIDQVMEDGQNELDTRVFLPLSLYYKKHLTPLIGRELVEEVKVIEGSDVEETDVASGKKLRFLDSIRNKLGA